MARFFITGGAGFIGSHTIDALLQGGVSVTVFDKLPWALAENLHHHKEKLTYIEGDIRDFETLLTSMHGHTHVLHLAAIVSVPESIRDPRTAHDVNVTGAFNVFEAAREVGVKRVVYASSAAVYGDTATPPISDDAELHPQSPYGLHKVMNEQYAQLMSEIYGMSIMGLRYFNVYGTRQDPNSPYSGVLSIFMKKILANEPLTIYGDGSQTRDFISVTDIARANVLALNAHVGGVCNVGTGTETSLNDLLDMLDTILGKKCARNYVSSREGDILRSCASTECAVTLLNFASEKTFSDGITELVNVYVRNA